jgi:hypothetical protein
MEFQGLTRNAKERQAIEKEREGSPTIESQWLIRLVPKASSHLQGARAVGCQKPQIRSKRFPGLLDLGECTSPGPLDSDSL